MHLDCQNANKGGKDKYFPFSYHIELNIVNILVQKFQYFVLFFICVHLKKKKRYNCTLDILKSYFYYMCLELNAQYSLAVLIFLGEFKDKDQNNKTCWYNF